MEKIKKCLSIFIILCHVSIPFQAVKAEELEYESIIDNETFTSYEDGTPLSDISGWSVTHPGGITPPYVLPHIEDGAVTVEQNYTSNSSDHDQNAIRSFAPQTGRVIVETVVNVGEITQKEGGAVILYGTGGFVARVQYSSSNKYYVYNDKTLYYIPQNRYNDIRMKFDLQTGERSYDFYIAESDNEYIKLNTNPIPFMSNAENVSQLWMNGATMTGKAFIKSVDVKKIIVNTAPTAEVGEIKTLNGTLTCSYVFNDVDGHGDCSVFQWYKKGAGEESFAPIEGAVDTAYTPSQADDGAEFKFVVTPIDEKGLQGVIAESEIYSYTYVEPIDYAAPVAEIKNTTAFGMILSGNYEFTCDDRIEEENKDSSKYQWYVSDELFGEYQPIEGATEREFMANKSTAGKFLRFTVTPVDCMGTRGETAEAFPVLQNEGIYLDFEDESDIETGWELSTGGGENGTFGFSRDPVDWFNTALAITRNKNSDLQEGSTAGKITRADYRFSVPGTPIVVSVDMYVDMSGGTSETLYMFVYGENPIGKMFGKANNMTVGYGNGSGGNLTWGSFEFEQKQWHNYMIVLDAERKNDDGTTSQLFSVYYDGELIAKDLQWRTTGSSITGIRTFLQATNYGSVYMDNLSIVGMMDYTSDVNKDKEALNIEGNLDEVMVDLDLKTAGSAGSVISWVSSEPDIISNDGKVTRPAVDKEDRDVELTAYIMKGTYLEVKRFGVTVLRLLTPEEAVKRDAKTLERYSDSLLDRDITLPDQGDNSTSIVWHSNKPDVLSDSGKVTRPADDEKVIMTATVTREGESCEIDIPMYVLRSVGENWISHGMVSASSQKADYRADCVIDDDFYTVWHSSDKDTEPVIEIDLGTKREFTKMLISEEGNSISGVKVEISNDKETWEQGGYISSVGERFAWIDLSVMSGRYLRLTFSKTGSNIKVRDVRLYDIPSETNILQRDLANLKLDIPDKVISDFDLQTVLNSGTKVTYNSSDTSVIYISGSKAYVTRPAGNDKTVVITARLTYGNETDEKTFRVNVSGKGTQSGSGGSGGSSGGSSGGGGGGGIAWNSGKAENTVSDSNTSQPAGSKPVFNDLGVVPWAEKAILKLAGKGILQGSGDNRFEPMLNVKREEFAAMLVRMLGITLSDSDTAPDFEDVKPDAWYADVIACAYNAKITDGISDRMFGIGHKLTREDMAVMIARTMGIDTEGYTVYDIKFNDRDKISDYAVGSVAALSDKGVINGDDAGNFNPKAPATRAECAVVIAAVCQ